jgi:hypothetical protein
MRKINTIVVTIASAIVAACGGGGGGGTVSSTLTGKVIDGYIVGAKVCLDVNSNLLCDPNEPSAVTTAGGNYSLSYDGSVDGMRILAVVEQGAVDEDLGPVEKPFNLLTPAEAPTVLSPLTTMVAFEMSSKGVTASEATASIKAALNLQASNLLGYDFKAASVSGTDKETLKIAQVAASALAAVKEEFKNNPTLADNLSKGEIFKAAVKQVQNSILPTLIKSDGTLNISVDGKSHSQISTLVKSESNLTNVISGQIQQILANTKSGDGTRVDLAKLFKDGLILAEIRSGDYINSQNVRVNGSWGGFKDALTVEYMQFDIATINSVPERNERVSIKVGNTREWFKTYEPGTLNNVFDGTRWITEERASIFQHKPIITGNCMLAPVASNSTEGEKICAVAKDVSGQKMKLYIPDICKDGDASISGCDPESIFPPNSIGYDFNITATTDLYSIESNADWNGYNYSGNSPTLENFIISLRQNPQWTGSGCSIGFMVTEFNTQSKVGKMKWGANEAEDCSGSSRVGSYVENTDFAIVKIGGKDILKTALPNIYRKRNPGDGGSHMIFGVVQKQGSPNTFGVYNGNFTPKNTTFSIPFGNIDSNLQAVNKTLFEAAMPKINITKPFPY